MDQFVSNEIIVELHTIRDMLRWTISRFSASNIWYGHGASNPWDEAVLMVLPSLHLPIKVPDNMLNARLTSSEKNLIVERTLLRINRRIPVAYITNKSWFCGYEFYIDERALIPRSLISELINNRFSGLISCYPRNILDMCTGNGCIAIACAYTFLESKVDAVDISIDALSVAEYNIREHGLLHRITPIYSNMFKNLPRIKYDLIIANPPYVSIEDMPFLPEEYLYEPKLGLISGIDSLKLINIILINAVDYLTEDGILICEVGNNMANLVNRYNKVPFTWLKLNDGKQGIFLLTKRQLNLAVSNKYFNT